jgi:hypothetical protein
VENTSQFDRKMAVKAGTSRCLAKSTRRTKTFTDGCQPVETAMSAGTAGRPFPHSTRLGVMRLPNARGAPTVKKRSEERGMKLSRESVVIIALGIADLVSTLYWVAQEDASEGNPVFAHYLEMGPFVFIAMKLVMLTAAIFLFEWARHRRPEFTRRATRFTILAYLGLYAIGFARLNSEAFAAEPEFRRWAETQQVPPPMLVRTEHGWVSLPTKHD